MAETYGFEREHKITSIDDREDIENIINEQEEIIKIKEAIDSFLNGNFFLKNLVSRSPKQLHDMLDYMPEIIMILMKDSRGLEILKVTGIYEFLRGK